MIELKDPTAPLLQSSGSKEFRYQGSSVTNSQSQFQNTLHKRNQSSNLNLLGQRTGEFRAFDQSDAFNNLQTKFTPEWLSNLFDEDHLRCSRGDYSMSLADLIDVGHIAALEKYLQTEQQTGLKVKDFEKIQREYGCNEFRQMKLTSLKESVITMLQDLNLQFLLIAALVATILEMTRGWSEGLSEGSAIFIIVLLIFGVKYFVQSQQERRLAKFAKQADITIVPVYRNSREVQNIKSNELVVGDLIQVRQGYQVPADCVLISCSTNTGLTVNEKLMNGDDQRVKRVGLSDAINNPRRGLQPFLLGHTFVDHGFGKAIVLAVGQKTQYGLIQKTLEFEKNLKSPLHYKLQKQGEQIARAGVFVSVSVFCILIFWIAYSIIVMNDYYAYRAHSADVINHLVFCIALIVVTIPEGLKFVETLAVSQSLGKLFKRNSLVRSLQAPEMMARCTDICVETTGCLTDSKIPIEQIYLGSEVLQVTDPKKLIQHKCARRLLEAILYSSCSYYELVGDNEHRIGGQETEIGMISLLIEHMQRWIYEAQIREILDENKQASQVPFNSDNKWMAIVAEKEIINRIFMIPEVQSVLNKQESIFSKNDTLGYHSKSSLIVKGMPEALLPECAFYLDKDGHQTPLLVSDRQRFEKQAHQMGLKGLRTVLITYMVIKTPVESQQQQETKRKSTIMKIRNLVGSSSVPRLGACSSLSALIDKNSKPADSRVKSVNILQLLKTEKLQNCELTIIGMVGLKPQMKQEVPQTLAKALKAGVQIRALTGDSRETITGLGLQSGLISIEELDDPYVCMTGKELVDACSLEQSIDQEEAKSRLEKRKLYIVKKLQILCRASPYYTEFLIRLLREHNRVVAATGSKSQDLEVFDACDVALSFGLMGSDIAKSQSAIELRDDNFESILAPISYGKNIFRGAMKYLSFLLTSHITLQAISLLSTAIIYQPPLNAMQLLWINVILDIMSVVAIATGSPIESLLTTGPYNISDKILTNTMFREVLFLAVYQISVLLVILLCSAQMLGLPYTWNTTFWVTQDMILEDPLYATSEINDPTNKTVVFTMVVHSYVLMQCANLLSLKIKDEKEMINKYGKHKQFIYTLLFILFAQVMLLESGIRNIRLCPMTLFQHAVCLLVAIGSYAWMKIIKTVYRPQPFFKFSFDQPDDVDSFKKVQ